MTITPITTGPGDPPKSDETSRRFNGQLDGAKAAQSSASRPAETTDSTEPKKDTWIQVGEDIYENTETGERGWPHSNGG